MRGTYYNTHKHLNEDNLTDWGVYKYDDLLNEIVSRCDFQFKLNNKKINIKIDDYVLDYWGYKNTRLGEIAYGVYMGNKSEIRIGLFKNKDGIIDRELEDIVLTFLHELVHLIEYKSGWSKDHKTHTKKFYEIHDYIVNEFDKVYNNELSSKVKNQYINEIELRATNKNIRKEKREKQKEKIPGYIDLLNKNKVKFERYNNPEIKEITDLYFKKKYRKMIYIKEIIFHSGLEITMDYGFIDFNTGACGGGVHTVKITSEQYWILEDLLDN